MAEISLKTLREERLWSKAELAREAGVSSLTIDRIERGQPCRPETLRKIILAFGYTLVLKKITAFNTHWVSTQ